MRIVFDIAYLVVFALLPFFALDGDMVQMAVVAAAFALLDHGQLALGVPRTPSLLRTMPVSPQQWATFAARHACVLIGFSSVPKASEELVPSYIAAVALFAIGNGAWTTSARLITDAKLPFVIGAPEWTGILSSLMGDYASNYRTRLAGKVRLLELSLFLVPLELWLDGPHSALRVALGVAGLCCFVLVGHSVWLRRSLARLRDQALPLSQARINDLKPEVMLYFSGGQGSTYQVNMWFPVLEKLDRRVLVVLRERHHVEALAPTSLMITFADTTRDLESLVPDSVKVALYVANVGKNLQWLRMTKTKHVFIGHGDSDKAGSAHAAMKAYDHMLVAGQAHIDRMSAAGLQMAPEYYIPVGRPQLELFFDRKGVTP